MAALLLHGQAIAPMQLVARVPADLFYWPLIQLAGAATDNIALGVSVGSKGRGNVPGATSDIRATLLLLLIGKCTEDPAAFEDVGGEPFFRALLDDIDSRVAYQLLYFPSKGKCFCCFAEHELNNYNHNVNCPSNDILQRRMSEEPESYQRLLQSLVSKAQQSNNEKLLENLYLHMRGILQLSSDYSFLNLNNLPAEESRCISVVVIESFQCLINPWPACSYFFTQSKTGETNMRSCIVLNHV